MKMQLTRLALAGLLLSYSIPTIAAYELGASEVMDQINKVSVRTTDGASYLLTGVPKLDRTTNTVSYLAVSPINPVKPTSGAAGNSFFESNRPMTWNEADASCRSYNAASKTWKLPDDIEINQLNQIVRFRENVLDIEKGPTTAITGDYLSLKSRLPNQFSFFWMGNAPTNIEPGLKMAAFFDMKKGAGQRMSMHRLLNVICVTHFTGPETPKIHEMLAAANSKAKLIP